MTMKSFIPFILGLLLLSCGDSQKESNQLPVDQTQGWDLVLTHEQFKQNRMRLSPPAEKDFPERVTAMGTIDVPPGNRSLLSVVLGGFIRDTPLLIGDPVRKGQVVATLENPEYVQLQQQYLELYRQLPYLEEEYKRKKKLLEEEITSRKSFLLAESNYKQAQARLSGLRSQLRILGISATRVEAGEIRSTIGLKAPFEGNVTRILAVKGEYVAPESPVLEIMDRSHVHLELKVFERDVMKVRPGQEVQFTISEISKDTFAARVIQVGKSLAEDRSVRVHADIDPDVEEHFLIGMFVNATIISDSHKAPALPLDALVEEDGEFFIYVQSKALREGHVFRKSPVKTGLQHDGWAEWLNPMGDELRVLRNIQNLQ